jgi:poly(3-hydroxybutyrate) depolymerase
MRVSWIRAWLASAGAVLLLASSAAPAQEGWSSCDLGDVRIESDFPAARADACFRQADDAVAVLVMPEQADINPSPWYAFRVVADTPRQLATTLVYGQSKHRYVPKLSRDGVTWVPLAGDRVRVAEDGKTATLELDVGPQPLWVAAQEVWPASRHDVFLRRLGDRPDVEVSRLGASLQGRPIDMLRTDPGQPRPATLIVVGRQHPPEISGARALEPFVETLLDDSDLSRRFRETHRVVVVPMLNPDGVEAGHWRLNAGGKDINRDWGPFTQPETGLMRDLLAGIDGDPQGRLAAFVDFHSTREDVFYTQRDEDPMQPPGFYARWLGRLQERMPAYAVNRKPGHQADLPTAKTWVYATYGIPSVTFEIGDETPKETSDRLAIESARALMETLLGEDAMAAARGSETLPAGDGTFTFDGWAGPPIRVWYHRPDAVTAETPVLFVMHGVNRDADRYRDQWSAQAAQYGVVLVVPEFDNAQFPRAAAYNLGNVFDDAGKAVPRDKWSFAAIEPLFDRVRELTGTRVQAYDLYGHSAGAQFVHRYLMYLPEARVHRAVSANAGWYTMPAAGSAYPYGLQGSGVTDTGLRQALQRPMAIMLGTSDTDTRHPNLRRTPEAMAQGPHRFARGESYFAAGRRAASDQGVPFGWTLQRVEGVVHDNAGMAPPAAAWLYAH